MSGRQICQVCCHERTCGEYSSLNLCVASVVAPAIWTYIEPSVGIISACLPFLRPLIKRNGRNTSAYQDPSGYQERSGRGFPAPVPFGAEEAPTHSKRLSTKAALHLGRGTYSNSPRNYDQLATPTQESLELQNLDGAYDNKNSPRRPAPSATGFK